MRIFDLNEIVCLDVNGTVIPLSVNTEFSQGFSSRKAELAYAIDAQDSFVISDSSYHNFTQEEAWYLTSVRTVLGGMSYRESSVYTVDTDFNSFATVLMLPSVALFGASPFALRLPSLLAACAALLFVYLLAGLLFKDDKYAFVFALLFAVCGVSASLAGWARRIWRWSVSSWEASILCIGSLQRGFLPEIFSAAD